MPAAATDRPRNCGDSWPARQMLPTCRQKHGGRRLTASLHRDLSSAAVIAASSQGNGTSIVTCICAGPPAQLGAAYRAGALPARPPRRLADRRAELGGADQRRRRRSATASSSASTSRSPRRAASCSPGRSGSRSTSTARRPGRGRGAGGPVARASARRARRRRRAHRLRPRPPRDRHRRHASAATAAR